VTPLLIPGANGQLARHSPEAFLRTTDVILAFYLHRASRLKNPRQPFKGHNASLNSLSSLIVKGATTPGLHVRRSLGVSKA
jgi:hypothetical protein